MGAKAHVAQGFGTVLVGVLSLLCACRTLDGVRSKAVEYPVFVSLEGVMVFADLR